MKEGVENILKELLTAMGVSYSAIEVQDIAGQNVFTVRMDDGRELIGNRGETLHALDLLVKKIAERRLASTESSGESEGPHFLIDINDYRAKQIQDLQTKALMMADRARSFQYDVELTPMSAYERLIVHTVLQNAPNVKTESQGEGRNRRVVIKYSAE